MKKAIGLAIGVTILAALVLAIIPTTRDEIHWQWASHKDEAASYESYIETWPTGRYATEAQARHDEYATEAQARYDELSWARAQTANTVEGFEEYLELHPEGKHAAEARDRIEDLVLFLQADGWEGVIIRRVRLKVEQSYPQIEEEFSQPIARNIEEILRSIGVLVVGEGDPCDAILTVSLTLTARGAYYKEFLTPQRWTHKFYYTGANVRGQLQLAGDGRPDVTIPVRHSIAPPERAPERRKPQNAPFSRAWLPAILDGLNALWGTEVYIAALGVSDDQRRAAFNALEKIGAPAVGLLIAALKNEDRRVRRSAVSRLERIGDARAVEPLIAALEDVDSPVRRGAATALGAIGDARAVEPLIASLKDEEYHVRRNATLAMGRIGDTRAIEPLIAVLKDEDKHVRHGAAGALGEIGDARAVEPLIVALKDESYGIRNQAAKALGNICDERAVEPIIAALQDEHFSVQISAAFALGEIGDARAVDSLIAILQDEHFQVRHRAAVALGKITEQDFGEDQEKWQQWWDENKNEMLERQ